MMSVLRRALGSLVLASLALAHNTSAQSAFCPADLNQDRAVDAADLSQLLLDFGDCEGCPADLNFDAMVDSGDVSQMLLDFGACPDDNGGSDCPPHGTLKSLHHSVVRYNGLPVGVRSWEVRWTGIGMEPNCTVYNSNFQTNCYPYGQEIARDAVLVYRADGNCSYFTESVNNQPPCPAYATIAYTDWAYPIMVTPTEGGCNQSFQVGLGARNLYHDGNCGTFWAARHWRVWWWYPLGHVIGECGDYTFHSDGTGGYIPIRNCPPAGTMLSETATPVTINVIGVEWEVGLSVISTYADGQCGSYVRSGTIWVPAGTLLGSDGILNYYSDGAGSYYTTSIGGCDPSGTFISSESAPIMIDVNGFSWQVGSTITTTYADGNCGTYQSSTNEYLPYGTILGSDGAYDYYSDGSGGYYAVPIGNCDPSGTVISSETIVLYVSVGPFQWEVGSQYLTTYADGQCGTYQQSTYTYLPYGTYLGTDGDAFYYSDGAGGFYTP